MARKVVSGNNALAKNEQLLKSLAPKPMSKKGIFKIEKLSNELTAVERSYFLCSKLYYNILLIYPKFQIHIKIHHLFLKKFRK